MKHAPRLYAQALATLIEKGVSKDKEKEMVQNLLLLLKKNGDLKKLPEIVRLTERQLIAKDGGREVVIETARPVSNIKEKIHSLLKPHDIIEEKINPELVGGMRLTINGESQIDASLRSQLDQLFGTHYRTQ